MAGRLDVREIRTSGDAEKYLGQYPFPEDLDSRGKPRGLLKLAKDLGYQIGEGDNGTAGSFVEPIASLAYQWRDNRLGKSDRTLSIRLIDLARWAVDWFGLEEAPKSLRAVDQAYGESIKAGHFPPIDIFNTPPSQNRSQAKSYGRLNAILLKIKTENVPRLRGETTCKPPLHFSRISSKGDAARYFELPPDSSIPPTTLPPKRLDRLVNDVQLFSPLKTDGSDLPVGERRRIEERKRTRYDVPPQELLGKVYSTLVLGGTQASDAALCVLTLARTAKLYAGGAFRRESTDLLTIFKDALEFFRPSKVKPASLLGFERGKRKDRGARARRLIEKVFGQKVAAFDIENGSAWKKCSQCNQAMYTTRRTGTCNHCIGSQEDSLDYEEGGGETESTSPSLTRIPKKEVVSISLTGGIRVASRDPDLLSLLKERPLRMSPRH